MSGIPGSNGDPGNTVPAVPRKSPSLMNMSFLKNIGSQSKTDREAQPPKRRGPKPDSRPAQTRRQELNRQAQRTHRERKEQYIRALEVEISRLREGYSNDITAANQSILQHRQALEEQQQENRVLKEILTSKGINVESELERHRSPTNTASQESSYAGGTAQSQSVGLVSNENFLETPDTTASSGRTPSDMGAALPEVSQQGAHMHSYPGAQVSHCHGHPEKMYDIGPVGGMSDSPVVSDMAGVFEKDPQLGIDFILALEMPCRDHMERLCRRAIDDDAQETPAGHVLMAICPPPSEMEATERGQLYPPRTYDLPHANLNALLNLSKQLVTDGEFTPIMALQYLRNHDMYPMLTRDDVKHMMDDLVAKIRCYGFGAVLENFEFMDSLSGILGSKLESAATHSGGVPALTYPTTQQSAINDMYS